MIYPIFVCCLFFRHKRARCEGFKHNLSPTNVYICYTSFDYTVCNVKRWAMGNFKRIKRSQKDLECVRSEDSSCSYKIHPYTH